MTFGDILQEAAEKDRWGGKKHGIKYEEKTNEKGQFIIRLSCESDKDAYVICKIEDKDETSRNYLRAYFLSMIFNGAIAAQSVRNKQIKKQIKGGS